MSDWRNIFEAYHQSHDLDDITATLCIEFHKTISNKQHSKKGRMTIER